MPSPYPSRSPVSLPGARRCRLARRLAAGLTPAEVAEVEATTEEEIEAFIADRDFSRLVAAVPGRPRAALRRAGAGADRDGDGRSPASGRHGRPARPDVHRLRGQPRPEPGPAAGPARAAHLRAGDGAQGRAAGRRRRRPSSLATRWRATASIRWARPMPPPPASPTSSAPRPAAPRSARRRARRRPPPEAPVAPSEPAPAAEPSSRPVLVRLGRAHRTARLPRGLGAPPPRRPRPPRRASPLPDRPARPRFSRLRRLVHPPRRAAPGRAGQEAEPEPDRPQRSAGRKPLGP